MFALCEVGAEGKWLEGFRTALGEDRSAKLKIRSALACIRHPTSEIFCFSTPTSRAAKYEGTIGSVEMLFGQRRLATCLYARLSCCELVKEKKQPVRAHDRHYTY